MPGCHDAMLRSRGPITSISSSILCCIVLVSASVDDAVTKAVSDPETKAQKNVSLEIISSQNPQVIEAGSTPSLTCILSEPAEIWWTANGKNLTVMKDSNLTARLDIKMASRNDTGEYVCVAQIAEGVHLKKSINVRVVEPGWVEDTDESTIWVRADKPANLTCHMYGYPLSNFSWSKYDDDNNKNLTNLTLITHVSENHVELTLNLTSVTRKDNGSYECRAYDSNRLIRGYKHLYVIDVPQVSIEFIKAVGAGSIYFNWTVNNGNKPIEKYSVQHMKLHTNGWQYHPENIGGGNTSYVLNGLENDTSYRIRITATNEVGESHATNSQWIKTLEKDVVFVPTLNVNGVTLDAITVAWQSPPPELQEHVHFYKLMATSGNKTEETVYSSQGVQSDLYAFTKLDPATSYKLKISACSDYTNKCGNWSKEVNATTNDGAASPPQKLLVICRFDNISNTGFVHVTWTTPARPNGVITQYEIILNGIAHYRNEKGIFEIERWTRPSENVKPNLFSKVFDKMPANTNYTVRIHAITRLHTVGENSTANCTMPVTIPDKNSLNTHRWRKVESEGKNFFKLSLPRISERNGPICCYRIFMVKLAQQRRVTDLPPPEEIDVHSYGDVRASPSIGAYVAEAFDSDHLVPEIILGDGEPFNASDACDRCIGLRPRALPPLLNLVPEMPLLTFVNNGTVPMGATPVTTTTIPVPLNTVATTIVDSTQTTTATTAAGTVLPSQPGSSVPMTAATEIPATVTITTVTSSTAVSGEAITRSAARRRRGRRRREDMLVSKIIPVEGYSELPPYPPQDGFLDEGFNYTGFIEVIVFYQGQGHSLAAYSNYFNPLYGGSDQNNSLDEESIMFSVIMQICIVLIIVIIILLIAICVLHRYTKHAHQRGEEIITLRNSFRHLCRSLRGRHQLVTVSPPDMPPIPRSELLQSYVERHRNSDYGFQHEFELLPDRFADRTTRASEARENLYKNRYPDIKCYDQTRVRLAQMDGICGSDYINANFVLGYKERKKFICAQGPMENTVCDYWRMIWEQHLELVLMLTNLEEYSKTKCAKYWPDKGETNNFGDITVEHVRERPCSDYVVRELKMTRTGERDSRTIIQYHFLVWKDFIAPEHPHAILRFIKRVNEAYSLEKGPILVHCSAGVGRTGTLVALDSLLQQLAEEGQVSIFNTVCDLRHQRNFLVQSLKQYIFIYRALMEMAQYGDTEIPVHQLKETVERLRQRDNGKEKCRMEDEYDRISSILEDRKSFSVGGGDENRLKNRSELVIPYDRNRVILTPVPGREHSTYINASFIEGYDNSESFVITQDPLDTTIADFWRMILEQCASTIVMLSDLSDGPHKCPRYWPDDESVYDHVKVRYIQSESCPYYTRRELCVSNTKTDESIVVTQYQYHGWPTVEGEVPEVTRGLIELVDQTLTSDGETSGPLIVHCSWGSDRSSMFVALSILIQQLRTERRVDIFTTTKKLRSQRHGMIDSFAQYEFLHRAIVNYSDLHNLAGEEPIS